MVIKTASTDAEVKRTSQPLEVCAVADRECNSLILNRYLEWLNAKKSNRRHWLGRKKGGVLYSF